MVHAHYEKEHSDLRYEVDEKLPHALALTLGAQTVGLILAGIVLTPVIVLRAAEITDGFVNWAIFIALAVSGLTTIIQTKRLGRVGAGYPLFMGTSGAFISIGVTALVDGGVPLLMTLIVVSSILQFFLAANLGLLRRIITPAVGGLAIMLIAVTVMPIAFDLLIKVPDGDGVDPAGAPAGAIATIVTIIGVSIFGGRQLRLWSPLFGLVIGTGVSAAFGLFETKAISEAPWIGVPDSAWPGHDLSFGVDFWSLLPAFVIVTIVGAIETYGDGIAIQRVSSRAPKTVDYRSVQGAVYADGLGNLLSGLLGTLPNTTYSTSVAVVEMTGVAARRVAVYGGALLIAIAFTPKLAGVLLAIPGPVVASYIIVLIVLLFGHGLKLATEGGLTFEKTLIMGLSFWLGVGFQQKAIFFDYLPSWAASLLSNGMTAGTIFALLLTALFRLKEGRRKRLEVELSLDAVAPIHRYLEAFARGRGWDASAINRLQVAAEEIVVIMLEKVGRGDAIKDRHLRIDARQLGSAIELDIVVAPRYANLEDVLAKLQTSDAPTAESLPFKLLASVADEVRHQQYHGVDFVTVTVGSRPL